MRARGQAPRGRPERGALELSRLGLHYETFLRHRRRAKLRRVGDGAFVFAVLVLLWHAAALSWWTFVALLAIGSALNFAGEKFDDKR